MDEFWPKYLAMHSRSGTRWFHFVGIVLCWFVVLCSVVRGEWWYALAGPMFGYGLAFSGHFWVEHNVPASFQNPFLSFLCDHRLAWLMLRGKLE